MVCQISWYFSRDNTSIDWMRCNCFFDRVWWSSVAVCKGVADGWPVGFYKKYLFGPDKEEN